MPGREAGTIGVDFSSYQSFEASALP